MDIYTQFIAVAKAASAKIAATFEGWEPGNVVLDKPRQALYSAQAALDVLIGEFELALANDVRNRGKPRLALHLHAADRKLTPYEELFLNTARNRYHHDGDLEFDDSCTVSDGGEDGEYVMCWKWVPNEAVEFPYRHKAHVYYKDSGGVLTHIETDEVIALDQSAAERVLLDRHWDNRLDASCVPYLEWVELEMEDFDVTVYNKKIGGDQASAYSEFVVSQHQVEDVRRALEVLFSPEGYTIEIEGEIWYINKYECECGNVWEDQHPCRAAICCPKCNRENDPYESEEIDAKTCAPREDA